MTKIIGKEGETTEQATNRLHEFHNLSFGWRRYGGIHTQLHETKDGNVKDTSKFVISKKLHFCYGCKTLCGLYAGPDTNTAKVKMKEVTKRTMCSKCSKVIDAIKKEKDNAARN